MAVTADLLWRNPSLGVHCLPVSLREHCSVVSEAGCVMCFSTEADGVTWTGSVVRVFSAFTEKGVLNVKSIV